MDKWSLGIIIATMISFAIGSFGLLIPFAIIFRILKRYWPSKTQFLFIGVIGGLIGVFIL